MVYNVLVNGEAVSQHRKWHPAFAAGKATTFVELRAAIGA